MLDIQNLIQKLAVEFKLPDLALNENGICFLTFDDRMQVAIEASPEPYIIFLYGALCPIPKENKAELYETLMEAHLFGIGSRGATFGASEKFGYVFLFKRFDLREITYEGFLRDLESFMQAYNFWLSQVPSPVELTPLK